LKRFGRGAGEDREGGNGCFEGYGAEGCGLCDSGVAFGSCEEALAGVRETLAWLRGVDGLASNYTCTNLHDVIRVYKSIACWRLTEKISLLQR